MIQREGVKKVCNSVFLSEKEIIAGYCVVTKENSFSTDLFQFALTKRLMKGPLSDIDQSRLWKWILLPADGTRPGPLYYTYQNSAHIMDKFIPLFCVYSSDLYSFLQKKKLCFDGIRPCHVFLGRLSVPLSFFRSYLIGIVKKIQRDVIQTHPYTRSSLLKIWQKLFFS